MRVKVKNTFRDKFNTSRIFRPGEVLDFDEERAKNIVRLGLAEPVAAEASEAPAEPVAPKKPRAPRKKK